MLLLLRGDFGGIGRAGELAAECGEDGVIDSDGRGEGGARDDGRPLYIASSRSFV